MNPRNRILTSLLAGTALLTTQAHAAVIFSDDFSAAGSGTGWAASTTWSAGTVSGGEITVASPANTGNTQAFRNLGSSITVLTADFWLVANLRWSGNVVSTQAWFGIGFFNSTTEDLFFGSDTATTNWELDTIKSNDVESTVANYTGNSTLLVAHITGTQIDMWINPSNTSSAGALGTADATYSSTPTISTQSQWTRLRIAAGIGSAQTGGVISSVTVNDMTASTTFAEAIPEPSSGLLAVLASSVLFLRRRRA